MDVCVLYVWVCVCVCVCVCVVCVCIGVVYVYGVNRVNICPLTKFRVRNYLNLQVDIIS